MAEDEAETVKTLKTHKDLIGGLVRQYAGRLVDAVGDNLLAEFPSVVDALACGVAMPQRRWLFALALTLVCIAPTSALSGECDDGLDGDGDGLIDYGFYGADKKNVPTLAYPPIAGMSTSAKNSRDVAPPGASVSSKYSVSLSLMSFASTYTLAR